ncbi:hypothetical protein J6590_033535 [Homalodisca vitripennis]|nr:hypothetical protein J6590_033535 [Homalodisca vitripennis]
MNFSMPSANELQLHIPENLNPSLNLIITIKSANTSAVRHDMHGLHDSFIIREKLIECRTFQGRHPFVCLGGTSLLKSHNNKIPTKVYTKFRRVFTTLPLPQPPPSDYTQHVGVGGGRLWEGDLLDEQAFSEFQSK